VEMVWNICLLILILGGSALVTQWFAHNMYNRCQKCGSLNAKRRSSCRVCRKPIM